MRHAPAGQFSEELDNLLHVGTQDALRKLVQQRKLTRQKVAGQFLYCAADRTRKAQQLSARRALLAAPGLVGPVPDADLMPDQLRAAIVLFASLLDERQRRLYAGLESLKCGWGGDARIAGLLGIDPGTVARGRKQLLAQDIKRERVRRPGGGRPPLEKNSRGDRCHRSGLAARCRRRSHHRYPLDPPHHREDRNRTRHPRHPGLSQDRRPHPQGSRLPAARQPQARLGRIRPRPRPAVSVYRRAARPIRPTRPADRQHRYQKARTDRQLQEPRHHLGTISRSPFVTTPAAPPSGTRSTIACSARSARTGPATRCAATGRSLTTSVPPPRPRGCA